MSIKKKRRLETAGYLGFSPERVPVCRLYEGDTLDEVYPRDKEAGPFWWHQEKPNRSQLPGIDE